MFRVWWEEKLEREFFLEINQSKADGTEISGRILGKLVVECKVDWTGTGSSSVVHWCSIS
jgi:hypothetical protein